MSSPLDFSTSPIYQNTSSSDLSTSQLDRSTSSEYSYSSSSYNSSTEDLMPTPNSGTPISGTPTDDIVSKSIPRRSRTTSTMGTSPSEKKILELGLKSLEIPCVNKDKYEVKIRERVNGERITIKEFSYKKLLNSCVEQLQKDIKCILEEAAVFKRINYAEITKSNNNKKTPDKRNVDLRITSLANIKIDMKPATQIFVDLITNKFKKSFEVINSNDLPKKTIEAVLNAMKASDDSYLRFLYKDDPAKLEEVMKERAERFASEDIIKPFVKHFDDEQCELILGDFVVGDLITHGYISLLNDTLPDEDENSEKDLKTRVKELLVDHIHGGQASDCLTLSSENTSC